MAQSVPARPRPRRPVAQASGTEAADRVADVLSLFTEGPAAVGVSEIARQLDLSKAVVHRILQSLVSRGFVLSDGETREYRLGPAARALGARALRDHDLRRAARDVLRRLRDATRETTTLSELVQLSRVYLDQYESPQEIKMTVEVGRPYPLYAGASSLAMLAHLPLEVQEQALSGELKPLTEATISDPISLRRQLAEVRRRGVATSLGERQAGAASVAAPLFGIDGDVQGSISVCGPISRFTPEITQRYAPLVLAAAQEISRLMGWGGPGFGHE